MGSTQPGSFHAGLLFHSGLSTGTVKLSKDAMLVMKLDSGVECDGLWSRRPRRSIPALKQAPMSRCDRVKPGIECSRDPW